MDATETTDPLMERLEQMFAERERSHERLMNSLDALADALRGLNEAMDEKEATHA